MDPWRLTINQIEAGYAVYRFQFDWDGTYPPPEGVHPVQTDAAWYGSVQKAYEASEKFRESLPR